MGRGPLVAQLGTGAVLTVATALTIGGPRLPSLGADAAPEAGTSLVLSIASVLCWAALAAWVGGGALEWARQRRAAVSRRGRYDTRRATLVAVVGALILLTAVMQQRSGYAVCCGGAASLQEATRAAH